MRGFSSLNLSNRTSFGQKLRPQVEKVRSEAMAIIEAKEDIQTTLEMLSSQENSHILTCHIKKQTNSFEKPF